MSNLDLIAERLSGHRYERYVAAHCIFHDDHKPSLFIYDDRYFCASCGARGTTKSLLKRLGTIPERILAGTTRISRNPFTRWIEQFGSIQNVCNQAKRQSAYLVERGIPKEVQRTLKIGILEDWIIFPITNHFEEIIGAVARRGKENPSKSKYILPRGQSPQLLYVPSWKAVKEHREVFVTFGIIDALTLFILGKAACSTTTGQHINVEAFSGFKGKLIFIPDELEEKSAYDISCKLGLRGSVKVLPYPYGTKDCNEWFMQDKKSLEAIL